MDATVRFPQVEVLIFLQDKMPEFLTPGQYQQEKSKLCVDAVHWNRLEVLKCLLNMFQPDADTINNWYSAAAYCKTPDMLQFLFENYPRDVNQPDAKGNTLAHIAASRSDGGPVLAFLLAQGAKLGAVNLKGESVFDLCKYPGVVDVAWQFQWQGASEPAAELDSNSADDVGAAGGGGLSDAASAAT